LPCKTSLATIIIFFHPQVALKRLEDGIPNTALREIKALQEIEDNEYVVRLREVLPHGMGFVLVFEYMLSDLSEVIRNSERPLTEAQVSYTFYQLIFHFN
jgi:cell cycle related kinase